MIVRVDESDAQELTEIALKSKSFWGYSNELLESWRNNLTVTSAMISNCAIFKFLVDDRITGFYILNPPKKKSIELEMLFVLPEFIDKGIGKQLLLHSFDKALKLNVNSMTLLADPNAVPFYKSRGFYEIDKKESAILGRFLPVLKKDLKQ
ncbi:GNAT family N-acetyltransferase [Polaribacter sp. SA4-12]|uniref:GNAT family N-acetyltransferase n=1 Tax=Polaribacter sp. SA4-12 TaxID=1312072 RepID=UPI000B3C5E78|nr:GNAT family N-acetyltransferase [Polaribacter sp. SA4-12]ARV15328.1 GNAT family N-acetyltransferase [Polaribacter sp. SA4-12]